MTINKYKYGKLAFYFSFHCAGMYLDSDYSCQLQYVSKKCQKRTDHVPTDRYFYVGYTATVVRNELNRPIMSYISIFDNMMEVLRMPDI